MPRPRPTTIIGACRCRLAALPRDAEYGVFEIGMNHFGEIRNLVSFVRPHVALITTIAPAHLEFFGTCEAIADAKSEIFEGLVPGGAALIPSDNRLMPNVWRRAPHRPRCRASGALRQQRRGETCFLHAGRRRHAGQGRYSGPRGGLFCRRAGRTYRAECRGALAAVALMDGDVLNAAAALKNFTALKGRGARFAGGRHSRDRRKLQRQSRVHGGGAGAAGRRAKAARSRCWATCWKWAKAAGASCRLWPSPSPPRIPIWSSRPGRR